MGLLSRQLAKSGIVELVATTAPGLDDLLVLGRIKAFEQEVRADVIIVDGPAAGHAIDLVQAPIQLKRAINTGPIGSQADEVLNMLADERRCKLLMVTTAAITPIAETMEAISAIQRTVKMSLAPIVVNKCDEDVPAISTALESPLSDAYEYARQRYTAQQDAMQHLATDIATSQIHVARHRVSGVALVEEIAADISAQIGGDA
jgi:anion-transporting  ArsA/GET3 family ATPase